jgi:hypothetical protein
VLPLDLDAGADRDVGIDPKDKGRGVKDETRDRWRRNGLVASSSKRPSMVLPFALS